MPANSRPKKRQKLAEEPPKVAEAPKNELSSDEDIGLMDSAWASITELNTSALPPEPAKPAPAVEPDDSDEDDYSHLLDLGVAEDLSLATSAPVKAEPDLLGTDLPPASSRHDPLAINDAVDTDKITVTNDAAAMALQNLQAMLATAAAEAEGEIGAEVEDEMILSEEDMLDEEIESDEDTLAGLTKMPICSTCSQTFADADALSKHIFTHIKTTAFICEGCQKPFSRADALKRHTLGATASEACQAASLEPNAHSQTLIEQEHAKLLNDSLHVSIEPAFKHSQMRSGRPARKSALAPPPVPVVKPPPKPKKASKKQPQPNLEEQRRLQELAKDREELKPVFAALMAGHVSHALSKCVESGGDVKEVFRLAGVTGKHLALLHFAFSEVLGEQQAFLEQYRANQGGAKK